MWFPKLVYGDVAKAMTFPLLLNIFPELAEGYAGLFIAGILGSFSDAIFSIDTDYAISNIWKLLLAFGFSIFIVPLMHLFCAVFMLKGALYHDRVVLGRFLDKEYQKAMEMDVGEVQYRLENDPNEMRYYWMEVLTKYIVGFIIRKTLLIKTLADRLLVLYKDREKESGIDIEPDGSLSVLGRDVEFTYPDQKTALKYPSFVLGAKEKLAVTGRNGSGKSTLIHILTGLLKGYRGSINVNGRELRELNPRSWRRCFAYVPQEPYLFCGTVGENVRLGNLNAEDGALFQVMDAVGIAHLKDKTISAGGPELSGGEKQRISIARALLKDAPILIFDEPGNHLDPAGQLWLRDLIKNSDKAVLFATHDGDLTQCADKVLAL